MDAQDSGPVASDAGGYEWRAKMHIHLSIDSRGEHSERTVIAQVARCKRGKWTVSIGRNGEPHEFSGGGEMPALIEAEGMLVILLPPPYQP